MGAIMSDPVEIDFYSGSNDEPTDGASYDDFEEEFEGGGDVRQCASTVNAPQECPTTEINSE